MSGIQQALIGSGGGGGALTGQSGSVSNTSQTTGVRSGTFTLITDGTFTGTGATTKNWFLPTVAGVGAGWSAKATVTSNNNTTVSGAAVGSWLSLSSNVQWAFANTGATVEGLGGMTIAFSRDGGATTAGSMTMTWDVGYTP